MSAGLHLAEDLELPLDILTQSTAVLAKKRAGKTNLGVVIVEEAYAAGVPVVVIDPKGDWYGIRAAADGSPKDGLPLPVFGGLHGDVPLEPTAGPYLADLVRERGLSCLLDVSEFATDAERRRFLTAFADRLYKHPSREPMLLMLEEAHEYIPQMVGKDDAKMVGVFSRLVRLGGYKGLGVMMLSQRSASLNKNVLSQVDNMFMLRTGSPQDRAAVQAWMSGHGEAKEIVDSLPALATGEFWLWQPERGLPVKARARMRTTYDAGATPKIGETPRPPATLADVDLGAIATAMAATIEKAKADDPKELKRQIAELRRELAARPAVEPQTIEVPIEVPVEVPFLEEDEIAMLRALGEKFDRAFPRDTTVPPVPLRTPKANVAPATPAAPRPSPMVEATGDAALVIGKPHRAILTVLATYGPRTHQQLAIGTMYSGNSGSFRNALGKLRSAGLIVGGRESISITEQGLAVLGDYEPLPSGQALIDHWYSNLPGPQRTILAILIAAWPNALTHEEVAERTEYQPTSGSFRNSLGKLRTLELIHGGRDAITADDDLGAARGR